MAFETHTGRKSPILDMTSSSIILGYTLNDRASINHNLLAGYETSLRTCEKYHCLGELFGSSPALHWNPVSYPFVISAISDAQVHH